MSRHKKAGYAEILLLARSIQSLNDSPFSLTTSFISGFILLILQHKKLRIIFDSFIFFSEPIINPLSTPDSFIFTIDENPAALYLHHNYSDAKLQHDLLGFLQPFLVVSLFLPLSPLVCSKQRKPFKMCQIM